MSYYGFYNFLIIIHLDTLTHIKYTLKLLYHLCLNKNVYQSTIKA